MAAVAAAVDPADTKSASLTKVADDATTAAQDPNTKSYDLRIVLLSVVGIAAFVVGIALALSVGEHVASATTAYDTAVKNAADTLIALGAGAAGAVIGLLAPSPERSAG